MIIRSHQYEVHETTHHRMCRETRSDDYHLYVPHIIIVPKKVIFVKLDIEIRPPIREL